MWKVKDNDQNEKEFNSLTGWLPYESLGYLGFKSILIMLIILNAKYANQGFGVLNIFSEVKTQTVVESLFAKTFETCVTWVFRGSFNCRC